jgi:putative peptidoglycan lipid II flippase
LYIHLFARRPAATRHVRSEANPTEIAEQFKLVRRGMIPTTLALTATQLNTLSDSLVAWALAAPPDGEQTIAWLGNVRFPMEQGAAAAIYFGERLYQFPLGLIGIAAATVVFPMLSRHAARGDRQAIGRDMTLGLRMVLWAAIPCAVGLVVLAEPITRLLFHHGRFTEHDVLRTARMTAVYGAGVWAYCSLPVLVRGFFALSDRRGPLRVALGAVALNLVLDLTLIWPLAETGLAAATAISAALQAVALAVVFSQKHVRLDWRPLGGTVLRAVVGSASMAIVGIFVLQRIPAESGFWPTLWRVLGPMSGCVVTYAAILLLIGRTDWRDLFASRPSGN